MFFVVAFHFLYLYILEGHDVDFSLKHILIMKSVSTIWNIVLPCQAAEVNLLFSWAADQASFGKLMNHTALLPKVTFPASQ